MSAAATAWAWEVISRGHAAGAAALVLLRLADRADHSGTCWPCHSRTAADCQLGKSTVKKVISDLQEDRLLQIERRKNFNGAGDFSNLFHLNINFFPAGVARKKKKGTPKKRRGSTVDPGQTLTQVGQPLTPNLSMKPEALSCTPTPEGRDPDAKKSYELNQARAAARAAGWAPPEAVCNGIHLFPSRQPGDPSTAASAVLKFGAEATLHTCKKMAERGVQPLPSRVLKALSDEKGKSNENHTASAKHGGVANPHGLDYYLEAADAPGP